MSAAQITVEENPFSASEERFSSIKGRLVSRELAAMQHHEVEEILRVEGLELMRLLLQDHLSLRRERERQAPHLQVVGEDGVARPHRRETERRLTSVFGDVEVGRLAYGARGHNSRSPLDAELNLPRDQYSLGVRRRVAEEAARGSFDAVEEALRKTTGAHVPKRQCEQLCRRAAEDFDAFYAQRSAMPAEATGELLVLSAMARAS